MTAPGPRLVLLNADGAATTKCRRQLGAFATYLILAVILIGLRVLRHPGTVQVGLGPDASVMMWCLVWWPYAIAHGLNPFISKIIWSPGGFNLTWSTTIPAVSAIMAPVTFAFGPILSYNVAALLAPAVSAWAAFALCFWLTGTFVPALVGGFFYGFSPYELGHVLGSHLSLTVNFVPPLCLLVFARLVEGSLARRKFVLSLAALLIMQCLISSEVLATMTAFGLLAWLSAWVLWPAWRSTLRTTVLPLAAAYLAAGVILSPFFYFALARGAVPRQPLFPPSFFSADLSGFVMPTQLLLLAHHSPAALAAQAFGNIRENEFYLGLPLIVLIGRFTWVRRSEPLVRLLAVMLVITMVAALGPVLHVADRVVAQVPWVAAFKLPLLKQALPVRLANYGFLSVALIAALSLTPPKLYFSEVLAAYGLAALLPNPWLLLSPGRYQQPDFFTRGLYRQVLQRGENIVTLPYGVTGPSMLWQAESGMYFTMSGGYLGPTPDEFKRWPAVSAALSLLPLADSGEQWRSFLAAHRVKAVVAANGAETLADSLGIRPLQLGGVSVYRLSPQPTGVPTVELTRLEREAAEQWLDNLLSAARCFLARGQDLASLNPVRLHELDLLPDSRWQRTLDQVLAGASHGFTTGLWIGPGPNQTLSAGLFVSPSAAAAVIERYRDRATSILYPYPSPWSRTGPSDGRVGFLLMTIPVTVRPKTVDGASPRQQRAAR